MNQSEKTTRSRRIGRCLKKYWYLAVLAVALLAGGGIWLGLYLTTDEEQPRPGTPGGEPLPSYNRQQIAQHASRDDCWIVLDVYIYDISDWQYPGDSDISPACGQLTAEDIFARDGQPWPSDDLLIGVWPKYGIN